MKSCQAAPRGWFTTGSVVTLLIACQFITGLGLTTYYVPSPRLAFDSVRFIMSELPLGWMLRGLHYWGASFLVVASVVHMLRVFFFGLYKAAARTHVAERPDDADGDPGVFPQWVSAAVGPESVLGDNGHHQHRASTPIIGEALPTCCAAAPISAR